MPERVCDQDICTFVKLRAAVSADSSFVVTNIFLAAAFKTRDDVLGYSFVGVHHLSDHQQWSPSPSVPRYAVTSGTLLPYGMYIRGHGGVAMSSK